MFGIPANLTKHSFIWVMLGLALAGLGCAASAPSQPTSTIAPTLIPAEVSAPEASNSTVEVGAAVGDRIPDFALDLGEGSTVTSQQLLSEGQPTFLFFFATW